MFSELDLAWIEKGYRQTADKILFDIRKRAWNPGPTKLEDFCKNTYSQIVQVYKEFEKTQECFFTNEILTARSCIGNRTLAFTVGEGFTRSESSSTHTIGWELQRLMEEYKLNPEPFDLKLLIVGINSEEKNKYREGLPIFKEAVGF